MQASKMTFSIVDVSGNENEVKAVFNKYLAFDKENNLWYNSVADKKNLYAIILSSLKSSTKIELIYDNTCCSIAEEIKLSSLDSLISALK